MTIDLRTLGAVYEEERSRITELVADLGDEAGSTCVPATPEWSIRDVLAHLTGLCADILALNLDGAATAPWTAVQVDARKGRTTAEILAEWDQLGPQVAAMADDFPGRYGRQLVTDITVHEHDLRGALDRPGERDSAGVAIGLEFFVDVWVRAGMTALGLGPLVVRAGAWRWLVGTGEPASGSPEEVLDAALQSTDPPAVPVSKPVGTLTADPFELFRALSGRRSEVQIRRFDWSVDPQPYLPLFGLSHFSIREQDLVE
jgi:uncharacterized protein (TIGR03083 family)